MIEQMTPVEDWGVDYPSIPCMPGTAAPYSDDITEAGDGDMYRIFTNDPKGLFMDMWTGSTTNYPGAVNLYQAPAMAFENILDPVDLLARTKDASGNLKPFYALQYQYFQGHHDWDPNRSRAGKKGGATAQSNGGDQPMDETSYRSANEQDLVPIDRWITSTVFCVPKNSWYRGYQFVNIITYKDSLRDMFLIEDNGPATQLQNITSQRSYSIPLHPELVGLTLKLGAGTYILTGNTPFACYSYGRTETVYKDIWGYAAPTGQLYGSRSESNPPRADITPSCDHWDVRIYDDRPTDEGIADLMLLNDPKGYTTKPPYVSYNCRMNPDDPTVPPFTAGDTSISFQVQIADPSKDAYAAIYVVDRAGNDTVIQLHYIAPQMALSPNKATFANVAVSKQVDSMLTVHIVSTGGYDSVVVPPAILLNLDQAKTGHESFSYTSVPSLPATLRPGDSIVFTIYFSSNDTNFHSDSLAIALGCLNDTAYLAGQAQTPIIIADDHDFQDITVGDTSCALINVRNVGNGPLILDKNWLLHLNPDYTFEDASLLPDTIYPHQQQKLRFCFHPAQQGPSDTRMDWGTNLTGNYAHDEKDTSLLVGYAIEAGLSWKWHSQPFTVECADYDTVRLWMLNTSSGNTGSDVNVFDVHVIGANANDFTILDYGNDGGVGNPPPFTVPKDSSEFVDVIFHTDPTTGYANRTASVVVAGNDIGEITRKYYDTLSCVGIVRHAIVSANPPSYNYGAQTPGAQVQQTFVVTNTGDTDFVYLGLNFGTLDFKVVSGPSVGTHLAPGASDTIVVQFTAKQGGGPSHDTLNIPSDEELCSNLAITLDGLSGNVATSEQGFNIPLTYVCHTDSANIVASVSGTKNVVLDSVVIVSDPGNPGVNQFTFIGNGTRSLAPNDTLVPGTSETLPVHYVPSGSSNDSAIAEFFWTAIDPAKGWDSSFLKTQYISGTGYAAANTLSLRNPVAGSNGVYTAVTANAVTVPVQLMTAFDSVAQVYGVQFNLRYYGDAFVNPQVTPMPGLTLVASGVPTPDPADKNYVLLPIHLAGTSPITTQNPVANVTMQYVISKDSVSAFQIRDLMFLDQTGAQVCWVAQDTIPATFFGTNVCGDNTLRTYLRTGGLPAFSIDDVVPNPVTESAHIDFNVSQTDVPVTVELYNALGQNVQTLIKDVPFSTGIHQVMLDASNLPSGLYTVFVSTPGFGASKQVIISK